MNKFSSVKVLVVGDVMLDRYWWGNVSRISPEAPVPVVNLEKISSTLGGAANVAANVAGLGATPYLVGTIGFDSEADLLTEKLSENKISPDYLIKSNDCKTTVKTRIIAHNQQIVRIDQEKKSELSKEAEENAWRAIKNLVEQVDIIVVSDYAKGVVTKNLLSRLITKCKLIDKLILIDPKGKNFTKYKGASMLTPNRAEFIEACKLDSFNQTILEEKGRELLSELELEYLLVTQGEDGMTLFERDSTSSHLPVELRNVYDVTGAGDTVIACLAVSMGSGARFSEAASLANRAAGLVIEKVGTTAINESMIYESGNDSK